MIRQIYTLGINFYTIFIHLFSLFNSKAKLWVNGRKNIFNKLEKKVNKNKKYIWFHCASLGEFEQAKPLIEALKNQHQKNIIVTFFSPSGYEIRKNYKGADIICYLPPDNLKNAKKFLSIINIESAFFIKYEFWFNYINQLHLNKTPLYLVSGAFRKNQLFFKSYGKWFKNHLLYFNFFFVQNQSSLNTLEKNDIKNCVLTGDTRFDRVIETLNKNEEIGEIENFKNNLPLIILGSSWQEEEDLYCEFLKLPNKPTNFKTIIAPHDVSKKHINQIQQLFRNKKTALYSDSNYHKDTEILIIDTIGLLARIYKYANIAVIGGGFGKGLHNVLEPAVFGVPMIYGSKINRFQEAIDLIEIGAASSVKNQEEFNEKMIALISKPDLLQEKGILLKKYVAQNVGATKKIIQTIKL